MRLVVLLPCVLRFVALLTTTVRGGALQCGEPVSEDSLDSALAAKGVYVREVPSVEFGGRSQSEPERAYSVDICVLPASVKNIPPGPSVGRKVAERRAGMADSAGEPSAE